MAGRIFWHFLTTMPLGSVPRYRLAMGRGKRKITLAAMFDSRKIEQNRIKSPKPATLANVAAGAETRRHGLDLSRPVGGEVSIHERIAEILETAKTAISVITGEVGEKMGRDALRMRCGRDRADAVRVFKPVDELWAALSNWTPTPLGASG